MVDFISTSSSVNEIAQKLEKKILQIKMDREMEGDLDKMEKSNSQMQLKRLM